MRRLVFALAACLTVATAFAATVSAAEVKITDRPYYRHDTPDAPGVGDVTIASCSNDAPNDVNAGGERQQNEPAAAVDPSQPMHMTAGSNDYCSVPTTTDAYGGFYWSADRGANWKNSLLPGYPTDTSAEGSNCAISPQHCLVINTGDPVQAFDRWGHVYYGVIGFNRDKPSNGSIFAARYDWASGAPNPDYRWTRLVARGTPSTSFAGKFEDKIQIEADRGVASPYAGSTSRPWGNVYVCWAQFLGVSGNNGVWFARSTDGGSTYSNPQKISEGVKGSQFCDIAVTANGTVYVAWRQFESNRGHQIDAVVVNKSTNGGASFGKPQIVTPFIHWDVGDLAGAPADVREEAMEEACEEGDGIDCAERESESGADREQTPTRDCGDGPFVCESGYVFFREDSQTRITADPTDDTPEGRNAAYIVYNATVPGTQVDTGTSYGTVEPGIGSRGALYFTRNLGSGWSDPKLVSTAAKGHQFFPDVDANAGKIHVVWQDSRNDTAHGLTGDYRTVPIANIQVANNPPGSISTGDDVGVQTFYNVSADRGGSFMATDMLVSTSAQMPQYEQFGGRDIPFFGDYNSISAVGNTVLMDWTDLRETLPGTDPRYPPPPTPSDGTDGFDVLQCRATPTAADTCPNAGGLDQNIFGAILP